MTELTNFERLQNIIAEQFGFDNREIKMDSRFREDFGADSLDEIELLMAIEDEFNLELDRHGEWDRVKTVADALALLENKLAP